VIGDRVLWAWTRAAAPSRRSRSACRIVIAGALSDLAERTGLFRLPFEPRAARARIAAFDLGHGICACRRGVALIGIVCETTWNSEYIGSMKPDDVAKIAGYELKLDGVTQRQGPNFREMLARFSVSLMASRSAR